MNHETLTTTELPSTERLHEVQQIDLTQFLPEHARQTFRDLVQQTTIERPENAFNSDGWTGATVEGVQKISGELTGKRTAEIGVGAGTISIILAATAQPESHEVSDYIGSHVDTTRSNATRVLRQGDLDRFVFHEGQQSLLAWYEKGGRKLDAVIACIPQVVNKTHDDAPDKEANYIPDELLNSLRPSGTNGVHFDTAVATQDEFLQQIRPAHFDLDLNVALLDEVREKEALNDGGFVCLTLGGRPGPDVLRHVIAQRGYQPEIIHRKLVQQDPHTDITSLGAHEAALQQLWPDYSFDFYRDEAGHEKIDATTARGLLAAKTPVYHEVFVVKCIPNPRETV